MAVPPLCARSAQSEDEWVSNGPARTDNEVVINDPSVHAEVAALFEGYERALVRNDVDALDRFFWRDERTVRVGLDDREDGFDAISAFRRSQRLQAPPRTLIDTVIVTFDDHTATVTTSFVPNNGA